MKSLTALAAITGLFLVQSCRTIKSDQGDAADSSELAGVVTVPEGNIIKWMETHYIDENNFRANVSNIADAMGYGWSYGCKGNGWNRPGPVPADKTGNTWSYLPNTPNNCESPGLKVHMTIHLFPEGTTPPKISTYDPGKTGVVAKLECKGSAGACKLSHAVQTATTVAIQKQTQLTYGRMWNSSVSIKVKADALFVGSEVTGTVGFTANHMEATTDSQTNTEATTTTATVECPLSDAAKKTGNFVGLLVRSEARSKIDYSGTYKVIPHVRFEGFARIRDGGGNHWDDHPTDRPIRIQQYGEADVPFWRDMEKLYNAGSLKKDETDDKYFSWADLRGNNEHSATVQQAIKNLSVLERNKIRYSGTSIATHPFYTCEWLPIVKGKPSKQGRISMKARPKGRGIAGDDEASDTPIPDDVKKQVDDYLENNLDEAINAPAAE